MRISAIHYITHKAKLLVLFYRHAVSDWMEIEKERGISVTSSVLQFEYQNFCINILDTPGHQDFSEDTYRTLMAAV